MEKEEPWAEGGGRIVVDVTTLAHKYCRLSILLKKNSNIRCLCVLLSLHISYQIKLGVGL